MKLMELDSCMFLGKTHNLNMLKKSIRINHKTIVNPQAAEYSLASDARKFPLCITRPHK